MCTCTYMYMNVVPPSTVLYGTVRVTKLQLKIEEQLHVRTFKFTPLYTYRYRYMYICTNKSCNVRADVEGTYLPYGTQWPVKRQILCTHPALILQNLLLSVTGIAHVYSASHLLIVYFLLKFSIQYVWLFSELIDLLRRSLSPSLPPILRLSNRRIPHCNEWFQCPTRTPIFCRSF